jgi:beta-glucosidase-like glycosyl hydrolase
MCAYNRVNGPRACASDWLLNTVLKRDWGYKGFVMSDWGAVPGLRRPRPGWTSNRANSSTRRSISEASWPTRPPRTRPGPRARQT